MSLLPFDTLVPHRPRRFLPESLNLGDWADVAPHFDRLEQRAAQCVTTTDLERWIVNWSELSAALDEESNRRYIAMTCHTDNEEAEKAYLHFVEKIEPQIKPREFALEKLYVSHPLRKQLPRTRYEVFDRDLELEVQLFRPANVPLETEEARLTQQYQKLMGSLTVQFQGEERTLVQMARYLEEPDRLLRQEAWELVAKRRLQEAEKLDKLFDQLLGIRAQIARNAGFDSYLDYAFRRLGRFDYSPADCRDFHQAVAEIVMPLLRELQEERRGQLGVETLRPWDTAVDPLNRPPLHPFQNTDELLQKSQTIFSRVDIELGEGFRRLREQKLLDLENRRGKAPGGYQTTLSEARLPFIFMNAVGMQRDVETILHEAGHAFHSLATRDEDLYHYQHAPIEFCEVASMSMELLGNEYIEAFYNSSEARRARRVHLEGIAAVLPWIATVDAFQHWIYTHPGHSAPERNAAWVDLMERFGGDVDWSGHEAVRANLWHRQLHIFIHPFYYIEYGIAQLGALQVWLNSRQDKAKAVADYKNALALGGSRPLPELFKASGCPFEFGREVLTPLIGMLRKELAGLKEEKGI